MTAYLETSLKSMLPQGIVLEADTQFSDQSPLYEVEQRHIIDAVDKRKCEFKTGRALARKALSRLSIPPCPIGVGPNREPQWPEGIIGSISHCEFLCISAVAFGKDFIGLGIDAEQNKPLPPGIANMVFSSPERDLFTSDPPGKHPDTLTFSAKESIFKCLFPLLGVYFDFHDVKITFDTARCRFNAALSPTLALKAGRNSVGGRYLTTDRYIVTLAYLRAGH